MGMGQGIGEARELGLLAGQGQGLEEVQGKGLGTEQELGGATETQAGTESRTGTETLRVSYVPFDSISPLNHHYLVYL